jgi:CsoR family transcriptional regulator, copper-sensing transcriptional repressor
METMKDQLPTGLRKNIDQRLQRLEGQVRGVRRMLDEDRDCQDVLTQLAAVRGAAHQISLLLAENYALNCVSDLNNPEATNEAITRLVSTLGKLA